MGEKSSFVHLLDKIEAQDRRLDMVLKNVRSLSDSENMELAYSAALKLAEDSEKMTLLTRALPAYTGNSRAAQDMETVVEKVVPVEVGFTIEGWFCVRLPLLLPKKEEGSASYIRGILYPVLRDFFRDKEPIRYPESVMVFRHVYNVERPERRYRDHDNIELNMVSDAIYCSAASSWERTEIYVVPAQDFTRWLMLEYLIPDEGVMLHEHIPRRFQKHM